MSEVQLTAEPRSGSRKHAKYVRKGGNIPGIFYAHGQENIAIQVSKASLDPLIRTSEMRIIDLHISDGTTKKCILRDVQYDPVSDAPIHFDLQGLNENEKLTIDIPIVLTGGTPIGVREGGILQLMIHKIKISCLPKDIRGKIEVDVANLAINHSVHVRELSIPNVVILDDPDAAVVGVLPPTVEKEPEPAVAEEVMKEPEVVGKGKKAEEGEEAPAEEKAEAKPAAKEEKKEEKKEKK
jgi:large subunit ribosomal protein L25